MAVCPSWKILVLFLTVGLISSTPIKLPNVEGESSDYMLKALRNVMSKIGHHERTVKNNETKPHDLDFESSAAFAFDPEQMRQMIARKMMGAEVPAVEIEPAKSNVIKKDTTADGDKDDKKEKEMKMAEQIGCSLKEDCNTTSYCNKLTYTCAACHTDAQTCTKGDECCRGFVCDRDSNQCQKRKGKSGERCATKDDCGGDLCCALSDSGEGECQPYLKEGAECGNDPFTTFFSTQSLFSKEIGDLPNKCPCHHQLKCEKKSSFLFVDTPVCMKKNEEKTKKIEKNPDHKSIIKITLRSSPIIRFHHHDDDADSDPLSSLLPASLMKMLQKPPMRRGFTMKISSRGDKKNKRGKLTSISRKFPFFPFPFTNPFDGITEDMPLKTDVKRDIEDEESKVPDEDEDDVKEERRRMVDDVAEEARASVHRAVDGIFDTIMKKITTLKNRRE